MDYINASPSTGHSKLKSVSEFESAPSGKRREEKYGPDVEATVGKFGCLAPFKRRAHQVMDQVAVPPIERTSMEIRAADGSDWASLPSGVVSCICDRVLAASNTWPRRKNLFAFSGTCASWRQVSHEVFYLNQPMSSTISHPMELFVTRPYRTLSSLLHCFVVREKDPSSEHGTQYYMYLGEPELDRNEKFLMAASHHATMGQKRFALRVGRDFDPANDANDCVASLRTNLLGTTYGLETHWEPEMLRSRTEADTNAASTSKPSPPSPEAIGKMHYRRNFFGMRGPRKLSVQIPAMVPAEGLYAPCPAGMHFPVQTALDQGHWRHNAVPVVNNDGEVIADDLLDSIRSFSVPAAVSPSRPHVEGSMIKMKNVPPHWHEVLQCWCLNFGGRVKEASVKNFQLMDVRHPELVAMQFGKVSKDRFILDFDPTRISPVQAFAVALSSFESKLPYE